jgi:Polyketide cyclase / dehydrase and lipid transport
MTPGVTVAETIDLDVPLERAWEFVADFEKFPDWFVLHEGFPAGPPPSLEEVREGTSITEKIKVMGIPAAVEWTVVQWDPPHVVGIDGRGPMGTEMSIRARCESSDAGGTRATHQSSFSGAAITPMLPALEKEARKAAAESLEKVRGLL